MAFNSNVPRAEYIAATGQTVFPFVFKVFEQTDVKVYLTPSGQISDDSSDLLQTGYTVSINGDAGGSVIFSTPTVSGDKVTLLRSLPVVRNTDYQENGDLRASTLDSDQDYQTYLVGDLSSKVDKVVKFPESAQGLDGTLPSPSADNYIRWNSTGTALVNDTELPSAVQLAKDWANKAEDSIVADGEYSAKHYSLKAEDEKEEATTQAGIAVTKADEASTSASQALGYRNEAEGFRDEAEDFALSINPDTIVANSIHASSSKTTPVDADEIGLIDSASTFSLKKLTWANLKATLKTYLDTLYMALSGNQTIEDIKTFSSFPITPSSAPTTDYQVANKKYVDDSISPINNKPSFSAYRATSQQAISSATNTKVQFNAEEFDTENAFDSITNFRFQPTVAGKYIISSAVSLSSNANIFLILYKNGSAYKYMAVITNVLMSNCNGSCIVNMNGSTDYIEIYVYSSVANNIGNSQTQTYFQASKI